jgi:hypothetical protein
MLRWFCSANRATATFCLAHAKIQACLDEICHSFAGGARAVRYIGNVYKALKAAGLN